MAALNKRLIPHSSLRKSDLNYTFAQLALINYPATLAHCNQTLRIIISWCGFCGGVMTGNFRWKYRRWRQKRPRAGGMPVMAPCLPIFFHLCQEDWKLEARAPAKLNVPCMLAISGWNNKYYVWQFYSVSCIEWELRMCQWNLQHRR